MDVLLAALSYFLTAEKFPTNFLPHSDTGGTSRFKINVKDANLQMLKMPIANIKDTTNSDDNSQDASNSHNDDNQTPFTAAAERTDKHKKRRNKKKRETSLESSSSNSDNCSS